MATAVKMTHPTTGVVKTGYHGFSWTSFFFGGIPAILRGDLVVGLLVLVVYIALGIFTFSIGSFVVGLIWGLIYNKNYTQRLLEQGYQFDDDAATVADAKRALGIPG